jgi:hypothetical protein
MLSSEVKLYLKGDLSFLPSRTKACEDQWGKDLTGVDSCMWMSTFSEKIVAELMKARPCPPKDGYRLDLETDEYVIEVKGGTYLTSGTAHEKIAGVLFKYAEVSRIFGKPLLVVCVAGAEQFARKTGLFGSESPERQQLLDLGKSLGISFVPLTQFLPKKVIIEDDSDSEEESHSSSCHYYTQAGKCTCIRI